MPRAADTPAGLLSALATSDPTRPRLTWYDETTGPSRGERVELSGRVLANWVAKAANLLQDELDVGPASVVTVDLPGHWRTAYWLLAAWSVGACVETGLSRWRPDVVVTDDPADWPGARIVAVTLPALVRGWPGEPLPAGAVDEARDLATYPDVFTPSATPEPDAWALTTRRGSWTFAELVPAAAASGVAAGGRVLTTAGPDSVVESWLAPWAVDGSLVMVGADPDGGSDGGPDGEPDARTADRLDRIAEVERVSDRR